MELNERGTWLESFQLIDEADHVIDSTPRGTRGKNDRILIVDGRVKTAGLRITYFRTSAQVHQPIDMKVSVGLP
jgi:hypothetical protein